MATVKTLQTTAQYLFDFVFLRYSNVSCITVYINIYAKKNCYSQSSLGSKNVFSKTVLFFGLKITSPLRMVIKHPEYS